MPIVEKIIKRNGQIVDFNPLKIVAAVERAFLEVKSDRMSEEAKSVSAQVVRYLEQGATDIAPSVETVQDLVERALMERGFFDVSKAYIIYRYEHAKIREERQEELQQRIEDRRLYVTKRGGTREVFDPQKLARRIQHAARGYTDAVDIDSIVAQVRQEVYDNIATADLAQVLVMVVRSFIERDPCYSHIASRLLLDTVYTEVLGHPVPYTDLSAAYRRAFVDGIKRGVISGKLDRGMIDFDLEALAQKLVPECDDEFRYLGLQTLYDRYFLKDYTTKKVIETPQAFWMRIAMGTALVEKTPEARMEHAAAFYEIMAHMLYTPSTPTLFHAGTPRPQLSSCYLLTVPDDLSAIFKNYADCAQLSKYSGGIGVDWTPLRATGAYIKGTGVESQGVIPFLKIANDVTAAINRSGKRRGATCAYLECWHYDFEEFLELRKNTGDERRRTHDMNTAAWIPDLFMKRVETDGDWTFFSPDEVSDLHDLYGRAFDERYQAYETQVERGEIAVFKRIKAKDLWRKMLTMLFETGHPWITFKDPSNIRSPQDHVGVVHSSNLCTEITLNTSADETAVCNLGSLNFAKFVRNSVFDYALVAKVVPVAMRMLDNVIDINFYPTIDAKRSNDRHRPVGLGIRGLQDALYKLGVQFDSEASVAFSDESMEAVSYYAILASTELAKERGAYQTFKGSKWDRGILPQDTIALLERERGVPIDVPRHERLDWAKVRSAIKQWGMRNSNTLAIAPTATTANIVGCFPTIEPIYKNLYVKSNQAGDFVVVNEYLINELKKARLWNRDMLEKIKFYDGSIQQIDEIPNSLKDLYKEVFDIEPYWLIKAAAYRGRWIDQSQSLNIFFRGTSGKILSDTYQLAWRMGLKTTYYMRSLAATHVEKSTVDLVKMMSQDKDRQTPVDSKPVDVPIKVETTLGHTATLAKVPDNLPVATAVISPMQSPDITPMVPVAQVPRPVQRPEILKIGETCESCEA
jgi:ribonucleoside-diphosphate reductase alpha chain